MLVRVEGLHAGYGLAAVLHDVSIEAHAGEAIAVIGPNGAGKTTLLKTIMGMLSATRGSVQYDGRSLEGMRPYQVARLGLVYVPAERELFPTMTVLENLELGAFRDVRAAAERLQRVLALFPRLDERRRQLAGTLSGGEQQMLAIGRALMAGPKVLMLDEPSTGLAPKAVAELYRQLARLKSDGLTIVLTEQQVPLALALTDRAYVLEQGAIHLSGRSSDLMGDPSIKKAYLGVM
ncbi:MAG TPA: ABC transporter ATP-binding protein [Burkholderiales bacterium]|nr:ABC transporter ATP-binding protein [Burkholderiales bacterium]